MQKNIIKVGDKIELTHVKSATRRKLSDNHYGSKLLDYNGFSTAKIAMPIFAGRIVPLEVNDEYDLCFFASSGLYQCRAVVVKRCREGKMFVIEMEFQTILKKFQRRQYYRLDCMLPIKYRLISKEEQILREFIASTKFEDKAKKKSYIKELCEFQTDWTQATVTDISGGGVRFQCKEELEAGTKLELSIPLACGNGTDVVKCTAKVIRALDLSAGAGEKEARCEFECIERNVRERIIKFIFEEQKRRLRKD